MNIVIQVDESCSSKYCGKKVMTWAHEQAAELSSGTVASITGLRKYEEIDKWREEFVKFSKEKGSWGNGWQFNFDRYQRYLKIKNTPPPEGCQFVSGDVVTCTNPQGVVFENCVVLGFSADGIHLDNDCWWVGSFDGLVKES
jgi:hypothetical protein